MSGRPARGVGPGPSTVRAAAIIVEYALRRTIHRVGAFPRKHLAGAGRGATARKPSAGNWLVVCVAIVFLYNGLNLSTLLVRAIATQAEARDGGVLVESSPRNAVARAERERAAEPRSCAGPSPAPPDTSARSCGAWRARLTAAFTREAAAQGIRDPPARSTRARELLRVFEAQGEAAFRGRKVPRTAVFPSPDLWYGSDPMRVSLAFVTLWLVVSTVLYSIIGDQDLGKVEWTLEWWFTFPVRARSLFLARIFETALGSPALYFLLGPFFLVLFVCAGRGWSSLPLAVFSVVYVGALAGSARALVETAARRFSSPRVAGRLQTLLLVAAVLVFIVPCLPTVSPEFARSLMRWADHVPRWITLGPALPTALAEGGAHAWAAIGWQAAIGGAVVFAASGGAAWLVRDGLSPGGGGRGARRTARRASAAARTPARPILGGVARKELLLVARDRMTQSQVLVIPALMIGAELALGSQLRSLHAVRWEPALAMFAVATLVLAAGACNALSAEVPALWMYCTVPRPIERVLADKAKFWAVAASVIGAGGLAAALSGSAVRFADAWPDALFALVGIAIHAWIGAALGVFGADPFQVDARGRVRPAIVYLFFLLSAMFGYAIGSPSLWTKCAQIALSVILASSLWQKVRDQAPYLLDPVLAPPPQIDAADGVVAVLAFSVLQALLRVLFAATGWSPGASLLLAFALSGLVVGSGALLVLRGRRIPDLRAALGLRSPRGRVAAALAEGLLGGALAAAAARAYLAFVDRVPALQALRDEALSLTAADHTPAAAPWLITVALVAAPLVEEFLFRAVLYGGFRRTLSPALAAAASALLFALVHPAIAFPPVFALGMVAALVYRRTSWLPAPILAHVTYNALVVLPGSWTLHGIR